MGADPRQIHHLLLGCYGPQGWWPLRSRAGQPGFDQHGYHRSDYTHPCTDRDRFEVMVGAILTQNTAWRNVERAIAALDAQGLLDPDRMRATPEPVLARLIRPSGYYNLKARRLRALLDHLHQERPHTREALLAIAGVGPETADSILLYAEHQRVVVIDAYTRRVLSRVGIGDHKAPYDAWQALLARSLPHDEALLNEFHALLVEHAKRHCTSTPRCEGCPLNRRCDYARRMKNGAKV